MTVAAEPLRTVRHYRIVERLGSGAMGVVFKAEDTKLGRTVALKFLPQELTRDDIAKQRFLIEARAASQLDHPNICNVHEIGESEDGQLYIAMALYEGETLRDKIARGPLPHAQVVDILTQTARGLARAHAAGIVHRDIKPANIIVTNDGLVKILDFGLAKVADATVTKTATSLGTIAYMAPEQINGGPASAASDVWALGVVAYEMLSGRRPFPGDYEQAVIYSILNEEPVALSPETAGDLGALVEGMLKKEREERIQSAQEVLSVLEGAPPLSRSPKVKVLSPKAKWSAGVAALLVLAAVIATAFWMTRREPSRPVAAPPAVPLAQSAPRAVAVLPFANFSGGDEEYFVEGMQDAVISELARIQQLRVISRTSAAKFQNSDKSATEIAKALNADELVEGSVVHSGDRVRVQIKLIRTQPDERQVWAETYDRDTRDVLALYADIAGAVAARVDSRLAKNSVRPASLRSVDPELYKLYLKGMFHSRKETREGFTKALGFLREANEKDPADPLPYGGLAITYVLIGHAPGGTEDDLKLAKAAALKALDIDPRSFQGMAALLMVKQYTEWAWDGLEQDYRAALSLNPNDAEVRRHFAWFLVMQKRFDEAVVEMRRARDNDPLSGIYSGDLGWQLMYAGKFAAAVVEGEKGAELDPKNPMILGALGEMYIHAGKLDKAIEVHRKAAAVDPSWSWMLGYSLGLAGKREEALEIARQLEKDPDSWAALGLSKVYNGLRDDERSLHWLEVARDKRCPWFPWTGVDMSYDYLRKDPRYRAILDSEGIPSGSVPRKVAPVKGSQT